MRLVSLVVVALTAGCARPPVPAAPEPSSPAPAPDVVTEAPTVPAPAVHVDAARLGYLAYADGPFPNPGRLESSRWVVALHEPYEDDPLTEFTQSLLDGDPIVDVEPADFERLGLPEPTKVWMFSDGKPCEATVGSAYAQAYEDGFVGLEVGYRLEPCTDAPAPVLFLGDDPPDLRWSAANLELSDPVKLDAWRHPARPVLERWGLSSWKGAPPPEIYARVARATNAHELGFAHYYPGDEDDDECGSDDETVATGLALATKEGFTELPSVDERVPGEFLVGELLQGETTVAVVAKLRFQMFVWTAAAPKGWTQFTTGSYHDEDVAFSAWSVLLDECEP